MHKNIFERLPRPDEVIKYDRSFRNGTKIQHEKHKNPSGCQSFIKCPERLIFNTVSCRIYHMVHMIWKDTYGVYESYYMIF